MSPHDHEMQAETFFDHLSKYPLSSWQHVFEAWAESKDLHWADYYVIRGIVQDTLERAA